MLDKTKQYRVDVPGLNQEQRMEPETSITLRDYFAGQALQAIISKLPVIDQEGVFGEPVLDKVKYNRDLAISSYAIADAMMKEKNINLK